MPSTRLSHSEPVDLHLVCVGLQKEELGDLYRDIIRELRERPAFRNPFDPAFDPKTIHELLVHVPWAIIGAAAGKRAVEKAVDIVAGVVERRLSRRNDDHKKTVKILGPDGKVVTEVVATPKKKKHRR
jgi:hypothetical protein